MLGIMQ